MVERASERIEHLNPDQDRKKALLDVSCTGAAFIHPQEKKIGSRLVVKIRSHELEATVVYSQARAEGHRIGVHFKDVPDNVRKELKDFVDEFSRGVPMFCEILEKLED
ncbi:MAG: PilZ domain-containing protein [Chitinispirillaceae bacterium]|nr:PilZ domain-containing protein [Chitinispirillaceae bacterium]